MRVCNIFSDIIIVFLILNFLNKSYSSSYTWTGLYIFIQAESRAGGLAENQEEKYNFLFDFYNSMLTTLKHHVNFQLEKKLQNYSIIPLCNSESTTINQECDEKTKIWDFSQNNFFFFDIFSVEVSLAFVIWTWLNFLIVFTVFWVSL